MPKLVRKSKLSPANTDALKENIAASSSSSSINNNNDDTHDTHVEEPAPTYEMLNPRYINETENGVAEEDADLKHKIHNRIGTYIEEPWTLIGSYFEGKHLEQLVRHQIESYNDMVNVQLKRTVDMFNPVKIASDQDYDKTTHKHRLEIEVTFTNLYLSRPQIHENTGATKILFPQEARLRNFTYASMMTVDMNVKYIVRGSGTDSEQQVTTHHKVFPKIQIGKMPIMLKSCICVLTQHKHLDHNITGECPYDAGGYFIINGSEKTVLGQERAAENRVLCYNVSKNNNKWRYVAEIKSIPDSKCISPKQINMMVVTKQNGFGHPLVIQIPRMKQPIPLFIIFRALGVLSDREICEYIVYNIDGSAAGNGGGGGGGGGGDEAGKISAKLLESLQASIIDANGIMTQEDAVRYFTSQVIFTPINMDKESGAIKKREFAHEVLHNDLFPHCNTDKQRIFFLGHMANKLLCAFFEINKQDDRDSYLNKRVDLTGALLNNLFRNYFNKLIKDMSKQVVREINTGSWRSTEEYLNIINDTNMYKIIKSTTIENGLKRALSTGDFGIKSVTSNKVGVAQVLNRLTYSASLSHLRRLNTPIDKSGKLIPPRKLHNTSWGFLCPAETPEGGSIGVVKNISYLSHVTIHSNPASLHAYIDEYIERIETLKPRDTYRQVKVFVNGTWVGITRDPMRLYRDFKLKKLRGIINIYTSVVFDYPNAEIRICNDAGRMMRPLLLVNQDTNDLFITRDIISRIAAHEIGWDDLLTHMSAADTHADTHAHGVIEYIDPDEQAFSMIAMRPHHLYRNETDTTSPYIYKYSHCEIHPSTIFGVLASCIPFPEHNQAPRNTYQCLDINETVLMSDGSRVAIKDVKVGDEVMTYHPTTFEVSRTKVVNHFIQANTHPVYKITTISGREIIATEDHRFSTNEGWKTVKEMMDDRELRVGVFDTKRIHNTVDIENECELILDEEMFRLKMKELNIEETVNRKITKTQKYINHLKEIGMIPLYSNNHKLGVLARIIGYLYADGSINIYIKKKYNYNEFQCSFDFGRRIDADNMIEDLKMIGFNPVKITEGTRTFKSSDSERYQTHHTFTLTFNGCLPAFIVGLGVSYGKKTETPRNEIPRWVMNNKYVSSQFISGFQGGDGCKIRWDKVLDKRTGRKGYIIKMQETSQQINPTIKDSLKRFMEQCIMILNNLDIKVTKQEPFEEDINSTRVKYSFRISSTPQNLLRYYETVGYSYCDTKNMESFVNVEYLKYKNFTNGHINIEEWTQDIIQKQHNCIFVPIQSIVPVSNRMVSDIEVASENHSFIAADGFASSNCAMGKQAIGIYVTNYQRRMDKTAYVLTYPHRPLVDTRLMQMIQLAEIPSGAPLIVAIMSYTGYNQEDSVLVNQGAIDRGMFSATIYHTEKDEDKKINGDEEVRCHPDASKTKGMKFGNYDKLNQRGVMPANTFIENRDIIMGKVIPIKDNRNDPTKIVKYEDISRVYHTSEECYVDKSYIDSNGEGYCFCKVRVRAFRKPVIGDKVSSRMGQKGTIGNIIPERDMPFTKEGIRPDIIINPHAIPSRMTIGQLKETLLGKVLVNLGLFGDGTSFGEYDIKDISKELLKVGFEMNGNELLYNGLTGEQIKSDIFIGPVFYQRLKHMVADKQHSRSIGPMVNFTHQPAEGRSRDGGLRFGEMERDAMVGHGASRFTKGRMYDCSDKYEVHVCRKCGIIASYNEERSIHLCKTCDNRSDFALVQIPYACKLLFQELATMNVAPRIMT
jgi:DNA-directed RNA polymerase beta subunit